LEEQLHQSLGTHVSKCDNWHGLQEEFMTLKKICLGLLAFSLVAIPAAAQRSHSNKGGAARADNRADAVQLANKKDKDRDPLPDNDTNKGKHKGETKGKHKAKGHSH
jgi:Ni/Co efflux regulator RcnB